ncbi:MAG: carboxy terminal-processing peptidase [Cyclobacteriaceae bacterium]|jgi:carboxyl-terminal processing protease|nr:carboxy terminal-processing peptidase [Cyclobacteriaceae bacterium]
MKPVMVAVWVVCSLVGRAAPPDTTVLKSKPVYGKEARVIAALLDNNHYRKIALNDSLSSAILTQYLNELDNSRAYFLASDVRSFEKYRFILDDLTRNENVEPAFEIYKVFRQRYTERMDYVLGTLVKQNFDFTVDEFYETDRSKAPWPATKEELNDVWRKIIKNQALTLKLTGKKPDEIQKLLQTRFERIVKSFAQTKSEDVFSEYMNAITSAYDPHTNYLSPRQTSLFNEGMRLSLEGIGARLQTDNDYTKIVEVVPGGPADKSGKFHVNDLIVAVAQGLEGEMVDVIGWRIDDVVKLIKGPKGTIVRLSVLQAKTGTGGKPVEITLVREKVKLEDQAAQKKVISYQQDGKPLKLGVITLPSFYMDFEAYQRRDPDYRSTTRDVKKLVSELQAEGIDGLVIDLRNNGGGSLPEAIDLTGLFIKDGPVVQVKNSQNRVEVYRDDDNQVVYTGPLVVMINRFSASASEIFAGAIQDYQRGVIVGESSYGKGTVQSVIDLDRYVQTDGKDEIGSLKITFQKFYRVTGSSTQHKGVMPDVSLPSAFDADQFGESASASALPWDVIRSTPYQKSTAVNGKVIADLNKNFQTRLKTDPNLKTYVGETEQLRKNLTEGKVTLNEQKRKAQLTEQEKKAGQEGLDTQLAPKDAATSTDLTKLKDEFLREGLLILSELVARRIG